jgi:hypothetical protein
MQKATEEAEASIPTENAREDPNLNVTSRPIESSETIKTEHIIVMQKLPKKQKLLFPRRTREKIQT